MIGSVSDGESVVKGPNAAEIRALLEELKPGIEAKVVGIFDGARSWLHSSSEKSPGRFWAGFNELGCLRADWGDWDRELLESGRARVDCQCGAHALEAFLFHDRWILIVLANGPLVVCAETVILHALDVLKELLPARPPRRSAAPPAGGGPGGGQGPAEVGIPVWWIRKRMSD
jgi:hypothetical protein